MDKICVEGGRRLHGTVRISGAKNAVLPVLAATLLTGGKNEITNIPHVRDVVTLVKLLEELGCKTDSFEGDRIVLDSTAIDNHKAPYELVKTMRASCLVLGPLLARIGRAEVSLPGGCAIGARPIDLHIKGLRALGATLSIEGGYIKGRADKLKGTRFCFDSITVTGTMNVMMAATLAEGETILENVAREPEVTFLADVLNRCGAKIEGGGSDTLVIQGVSSLKPVQCAIFPDRIEAATYMIAAAITGGDVNVTHCLPQHLEPVVLKLKEAGAEVTQDDRSVRVRASSRLRPVNIITQPYPGFATDIQAQFMALMTLAEGQSVITETVFENRFLHAAELKRMGANILLDGHTAIVTGVDKLSGAPVMATDLRASASLVLAGLAAAGETLISRVYHIDRGYETMEEKMSQLGAAIRRIRA
ncbi:UDP-N-acetylglucosamine 1-carboxyvinyltransferase [Nitrospina watsonii]|uniref:UDP-N-acetylglucosamine 1-carboxyvinyltransferase n=1 Tax=Nitrospina watsonii TaxID=1323948 RepID=A0ABM9HGE3_9BACT|nr:UDP-N-acetylglucosamine 1-carboxyvinyltransferase [Nitrospina watsonii]CAI2719406.1 UDP-N-acetylglucosamine 1-carboxyvinyltransferase [Nitrospina watsonii]